jgi:hypothetical protein
MEGPALVRVGSALVRVGSAGSTVRCAVAACNRLRNRGEEDGIGNEKNVSFSAGAYQARIRLRLVPPLG